MEPRTMRISLQHLRGLFVCCLILLICAVPTVAQQQSIQELVKQADNFRLGNSVEQDESKATALYRVAAERGSAEGQMRYGEALFDGRGITRDRTAAKGWLEKSAAQKLPRAEADLGSIWTFGLGVQINRKTGLDWFTRATSHGDSFAQVMVGQFIEHGWEGQGVSVGDAYQHYLKAAEGSPWGALSVGRLNFGQSGISSEAMQWYLKVASIQDPELTHAWSELRPEAVAIDDAIFLIGHGYSAGKEVAQDQAAADHWFQRGVAMERSAAAIGWPTAEVAYGNDFYSGTGVSKDYLQAMIWYMKAADQGHAPAQNMVGSLYRDGRGAPRDYGQAITWFRKAADQGNAGAQINVGGLYEGGLGVPKDYHQAMARYREAADQGNADAQTRVGVLYSLGWGVPQDYHQAMVWYRKAADQGYAAAQDEMGSLYQKGNGVPQDHFIAMQWFRKAADQGYANAQNNMGWFYFNGYGVSKDYEQAMTWYRKAADQGYWPGQFDVGSLYENGFGVPKDLMIARSWYQKAADQGSEAARTAVARLDAGQEASTSTGQPQQQGQRSPDQQAKRQEIADFQSRIRDLKDDADVNERAAENFDQEGQSLQGSAAVMARTFAIQKRQEVQRINRQINDLQQQLQAIQSKPVAADPANAASNARAVPAGGMGAPAGAGSGGTPSANSASACWSSELDAINDPVVRARMGNNVVQETIQVAQAGGAEALDQQITLMQRQQEQARNGLRTANADISAIGEGEPPVISPRTCATMRQSGGEPYALMAAMCQRLTMQNTLHLANGLIEVMQCVRQAVR